MKTKHILYLFFSILLGYITADIIKPNHLILVYTISILAYWAVFFAIDCAALSIGHPVISTEKRQHCKQRETGGDIARTLAVILVPVIHFFGLTGYYETPFTKHMIFPTFIRWFAVCSIPMFMIISGYFKINSKFDKKHYKTILTLLCTHIFIGFLRIISDYYCHGVNIDIDYIIQKIVFFEYGWYVRLYIGMLLIMPFFNTAYKNLDKKWKKEIFILTLIGLNALGPLTFNLIPSTWMPFYIFGYYITGCYLSEYKVKIHPIATAVFTALILAIISIATYIHCKNNVFDWDYLAYSYNSGYSSMPAFIVSAAVISALMNIKNKPAVISEPFKSISCVSLEMYLFSQLFDALIYKNIFKYPFLDSFKKIIILTVSCIALSYIASWSKKFIFAVIKFISENIFLLLLKIVKIHKNSE